MGCNRSILSFIAHLFIAHSFIARLLIAVTALQLQYHYASMQMNAMPIDLMFRNEKKNINLILFNEIYNFIEVYNNLAIELLQCFETSLFARIDHLASSVIKFRPKNLVPKHCMSSITYNYYDAWSTYGRHRSQNMMYVLMCYAITLYLVIVREYFPDI